MSNQGDPLEITVVVPVFRGDTSIERCLAAIRENRPAEVILVDAGASPRTIEAAREYVDLVIDGGGSHADVLQTGARAAHRPWVAFVDADVVLEPDALYQLTCLSLAERLRARDTALMVGRDLVLAHGLDAPFAARRSTAPDHGRARSDEPIGGRVGRLVRQQGAAFAVLLALGIGAGLVLGVRAISAAYDGTSGATALVIAAIVLLVALELAKGFEHTRTRAAVAQFATPITSLAVFAFGLAAIRLASVIGI